jgi:hypothetical protein
MKQARWAIARYIKEELKVSREKVDKDQIGRESQ